MVMDIKEIMETIPHRQPFLLIDRIEELEPGKRAVGKKCVSYNEPFFNGHFPGHPIMPGVLIVEGMAQCLGVLVMDGVEGKVPYFVGVESAKFKSPIKPGDQVIYEVEVEKIKRNFVKAHGVAKVDGVLACEATFTFCITDK